MTGRVVKARSSPRWALVGGLLGALLALCLLAPAAWLADAVTRITQGRLQLQEARGTVWNGSARLLLTGGSGSKDQAYLPGRLSWSVQPGITQWNLAVTADCCSTSEWPVSIRPGIGLTQVVIANQRVQLPAPLLSALGTPWNTIGLDGTITLQTQNLSLQWAQGRLGFEGSAVVSVLQASSHLATVRPLGSYQATIAGGATPSLDLVTLEGALILTGKGQWNGSKLRFTGEASASPEAETSLNNLLNIMGRRQGARSIITLG